jgi:hypothetical protein
LAVSHSSICIFCLLSLRWIVLGYYIVGLFRERVCHPQHPLLSQLLSLSHRSGQDEEAALQAIAAMDVVLKHRVAQLLTGDKPGVAVGRSFLFPTNFDLGGGAQLWQGYRQSIRPCQTGLSLTLDSAAGAVLKCQPLAKLMVDLVGPPQGQGGKFADRQLRTLFKELRGVKVKATHNGFKRTITGLTGGSPFEESVSGCRFLFLRSPPPPPLFQAGAVPFASLPCLFWFHTHCLVPQKELFKFLYPQM